MSIQKRKIGYYNITFTDGETYTFNNNLFFDFMKYLSSLEPDEKIFRDTKNKKAISIDSIAHMKKEGMDFLKVIFKSCKYNHFPDYMSSVDGSERPTSKTKDEGDKELTHMMMRVGANEAYTIFEERKSGVSMGGMIKYFNEKLKSFYTANDIDSNEHLWSGAIPADDFLPALESAKKITLAEMFISHEVLGNAGLMLFDNGEYNGREEITLVAKAKKRDSLKTRGLRKLYTSICSEGTRLSRIRLYGKDIDGMDMVLDSLNMQKKKEITVELRPNGTIDSYSIFAKLEEIFGVTQ